MDTTNKYMRTSSGKEIPFLLFKDFQKALADSEMLGAFLSGDKSFRVAKPDRSDFTTALKRMSRNHVSKNVDQMLGKKPGEYWIIYLPNKFRNSIGTVLETLNEEVFQITDEDSKLTLADLILIDSGSTKDKVMVGFVIPLQSSAPFNKQTKTESVKYSLRLVGSKKVISESTSKAEIKKSISKTIMESKGKYTIDDLEVKIQKTK